MFFILFFSSMLFMSNAPSNMRGLKKNESTAACCFCLSLSYLICSFILFISSFPSQDIPPMLSQPAIENIKGRTKNDLKRCVLFDENITTPYVLYILLIFFIVTIFMMQ